MGATDGNGLPVRLLGAIWSARFSATGAASRAPIVAILAPTLILLGLGTTDAAIGLNTKNDLQNATDAAALAVAHAVLATPTPPRRRWKAIAQIGAEQRLPGRRA